MNRYQRANVKRAIVKFVLWLTSMYLILISQALSLKGHIVFWAMAVVPIIIHFALFDELWTYGSKRIDKFFEVD